MRRYLLLCCLLLCLTIPLNAQDNSTPYEIALQRIQEAAASGATRLDLSGLDLSEVPHEVWQLTNLRVLILGYNQLMNVPLEIGQLANLQELYLYDNQLTSIPSEIVQLNNLQVLDLYANQLTSLPVEIGQLINLQVLYLYDNQLTSLPSEIGQLASLKILSLSNNQLQHLPNEMSNLTNLTCADCALFLNNNPLISPPPEVVKQGTAAVLAYLRNQAWYHVQRLIIAGASGVGLLAVLLLGLRYRQTRHKVKAKRG